MTTCPECNTDVSDSYVDEVDELGLHHCGFYCEVCDLGIDPPDDRPDADDLPPGSWECSDCGAFNSDIDARCQYCEPDRAIWERDHIRDYRKHDR